MSKIYDYAVVGAGLSGLTLSYHLADQAPSDANIALIDMRTDYQMDRIWCYWDVLPHPFLEAVQHTWHSWRVRHRGQVVTQTSERYPYHYIPADRFYDTAFRKISAHGGFELHLGQGVDALEPEGDRVKPDALVRFLSDVARPADYSAVIRAMPKWPFLKTAAGLQRRLVQKKRDAAAVIPGG